MKRARTASTGPSGTQLVRSRTVRPKRSSTFRIPRYLAPPRVGFPKQLRIKHRYVEHINITTGVGTMSTHQFSCNGMYDPNIAGAGHQPMYFDQVSAIYNHYTVLASRIYVRWTPRDVVTTSVGVYIEDDTTITPASHQAAAEQNSARYSIMLGTVTERPVNVSGRWNAVQAFGPGTMANDDLQGSFGANPVEQQYFTLFVQDIQSGSAAAVSAIVTIEYDAVWDELKNLASS